MSIFTENQQLLVAFREGKPAALEVVYRAHARSIQHRLALLARMRGAQELAQPSAVADLMQEVFVRAFSSTARAAYDETRDYGPYLHAIASNCMLDALRRRGKEVPLE